MAVPLSLGPVHHLRLAVTDVQWSRAFSTELLGFQIAMDTRPPADDPHHDLATDLLQDGIVMVNGDLLLGLRPVDAERAGDRFDPAFTGTVEQVVVDLKAATHEEEKALHGHHTTQAVAAGVAG